MGKKVVELSEFVDPNKSKPLTVSEAEADARGSGYDDRRGGRYRGGGGGDRNYENNDELSFTRGSAVQSSSGRPGGYGDRYGDRYGAYGDRGDRNAASERSNMDRSGVGSRAAPTKSKFASGGGGLYIAPRERRITASGAAAATRETTSFSAKTLPVDEGGLEFSRGSAFRSSNTKLSGSSWATAAVGGTKVSTPADSPSIPAASTVTVPTRPAPTSTPKPAVERTAVPKEIEFREEPAEVYKSILDSCLRSGDVTDLEQYVLSGTPDLVRGTPVLTFMLALSLYEFGFEVCEGSHEKFENAVTPILKCIKSLVERTDVEELAPQFIADICRLNVLFNFPALSSDVAIAEMCLLLMLREDIFNKKDLEKYFSNIMGSDPNADLVKKNCKPLKKLMDTFSK